MFRFSGGLFLTVIAEEIFHFSHRFPEHFDSRQIDDAEVVGLRPVESASVDEQDFLFAEQVKVELTVVCDIELLSVHRRAEVESGFRLPARHPRAVGGRLVH